MSAPAVRSGLLRGGLEWCLHVREMELREMNVVLG